jgi:hypothetical protein
MNWLLRKIDACLFAKRLDRNLRARKQARSAGLQYVPQHTRRAAR